MDEEASTSALVPRTSVGHLIQKLMVMCKKPSIECDLSGVLDEYLKKLRKSQIYLSNGIFTTNFAEAALFIDNAVVLYSKKIEILWDNIFDYQKQMLSYERKTEKSRQAELRLEERKQKYKRRKKKVEKDTEVMDEAAMDCVVESVVKQLEEDLLIAEEFTLEDDVDLLEHCDDIRTKFLPKQTTAKPFARYNRAGFVTMDYLIYGDDEELMCGNRYFATERALFFLPEHIREIAYNLYKKRNIELVGYDVRDKLLQQFIVEKNVANLEATREMSLLINAYVKLHLDLRRKQDVSLVEEHKKLCMRRSSILLTRLPDNIVKQHLKKDDADSAGSSSVSQLTEQSKEQNEGEGKISLDKEPRKHQNSGGDSGFFDGSFLDEANETEEKAASVDGSNNFDGECENSFDEAVTSTPRQEQKQITETSQEPHTPSQTFGLRPRKRKLQIDEDDDAVPIPKRVSRRGPKPFKWLPTTTVKLKTFERFYHFNYEPEAGEGQVQECEFSDSEPEHDGDILPTTEVVEQDVSEPAETEQDVSEPAEAEPSTSAEAKSNPVDSDRFFIEFIQARQAEQAPYFEWRDFIEKKLASRDKTEFDIHKFGTDILNRLPKKEPIHFSSLMKGKKSSEVVRYFIASLQLANTYNIELIHSNEAQLGNDSFKVKLLSMERYHENLNAYHAPSEISLHKKLTRIRDLTASMSTPSSSKGCKKRKLNF